MAPTDLNLYTPSAIGTTIINAFTEDRATQESFGNLAPHRNLASTILFLIKFRWFVQLSIVYLLQMATEEHIAQIEILH